MKKYLLLAAIFAGIVMPLKAYAADITAGPTVWYVWYKDEYQKSDPAFLYGPVLSVKFNSDFNLTFVYLYGKFNFDYGFKMKRQDADLALNYRFSDYFKVFGGVKYMWHRYYVTAAFSETVYFYGPALGLSGTFPVTENLFLLGTLSGFYSWGADAAKDTNIYGINSTLALAYYITHASTVISLGGRYQYYVDKDDSSYKTKFYGITLTATYTFDI